MEFKRVHEMEFAVAHLLEASVKLKCSMETTARALILYHHFMQCVDVNLYDRSMIAAVALNLSARINEQIIDMDSLLCVFFSVVNKTSAVLSPDDVAFILLKKSVIAVDFLMLRSLEFNLNHFLAHQYIIPFLTLVFERCKNIAEFRSELSNTCIRIISDFYTTRNCLNYQPQHMAVACIDLALYIHGFTNDLVMIPVWYQGFCSDISAEKVKQIKKDMLSLYEMPKDVKTIPDGKESQDSVNHAS